jgi:hypothetical protein
MGELQFVSKTQLAHGRKGSQRRIEKELEQLTVISAHRRSMYRMKHRPPAAQESEEHY